MNGLGKIRLAADEDVPALLEIYAPYVRDTVVSFEYEPPSLQEFRARFCQITAFFPWLVWEEEGAIRGYAYGGRAFGRAAYQWDADASIYLAGDARGQGVGRRLYGVLEQLLAMQGFFTLYGVITGENTASLAFHRAMGFREIGRFPKSGWKLGRWLDVVWMEKELLPREKEPSRPAGFQSLEQSAVETVLSTYAGMR